MQRALSVSDVLSMKKETLPFDGAWRAAFGEPETTGVWIVWGRSGNGKTSFVLQLCKELCKWGRVVYDSLEEGGSLTMQNAFRCHRMQDVRGRLTLLDCEPIEELSARLSKRKSAEFVVIDSFQYTQMNYKQYIKFKTSHKDKLLIFVSHASGTMPAGRSAVSLMYDASLKVWVEGYRAFSKGRYIGPVGSYTVWEEKARKYWGESEMEL